MSLVKVDAVKLSPLCYQTLQTLQEGFCKQLVQESHLLEAVQALILWCQSVAGLYVSEQAPGCAEYGWTLRSASHGDQNMHAAQGELVAQKVE